MPNYKIHFVADNKDYTTTVPAETSGEAQIKFSKFFTDKFKPAKGIQSSAVVKKVEIKEETVNPVVEQLRSMFGQYNPYKSPFNT